jgi:pilus retraction protein PilT
MAEVLLNPKQREGFEKYHSIDFAFSLPESPQRFRGNLFIQQGTFSAVIRTLWNDIPSLEQLGIPPVMQQVALESSGIILIGGTVGAGKTTTVHAMVEMMNRCVARHIVTIEDPVEYLHRDNQCILNQREIGQDAPDFASALKYVVRQSPDVVVIGELRDAETLDFVLGAADVGRLVLATVHAKSVVQMVDRLLSFYSPAERGAVLDQIYPNMNCFAVQKLLPSKAGKMRVPAFEILLGNYMMRQLIREKKFDKIPQALRNSALEGMMTMDQSLLRLWRENEISSETALAAAERPQELENVMRGIKIDGQSSKILGD